MKGGMWGGEREAGRTEMCYAHVLAPQGICDYFALQIDDNKK